MSFRKITFCPYCGSNYSTREMEGRKRRYCEACQQVYYENPIPAATALVLNGRRQILLGKRSVEPAKGQWCLPGGFIELGETMEEAAVRELKEETGLEGRVISMVDCFYQESRFYGSLIIFGYRIEIVGGTRCAGDDMEELDFYDLTGLPPLAFESHRRLIARLQNKKVC